MHTYIHTYIQMQFWGFKHRSRTWTSEQPQDDITTCSTNDNTVKYLQSITKFPEELHLWHSPLVFISHTDVLSEKFPKDLFSVVFCFLLGLGAPLCLQSTNTTVCEGCCLHLDPHVQKRPCIKQLILNWLLPSLNSRVELALHTQIKTCLVTWPLKK